MQNIPNTVRERLKVSAQPVRHVGADMLTAFAERSLTDLGRDIVLEHLGQCAECREIVALALPEQESLPAVARPSREWLSWPQLRWGFAAAGVAVIVTFGVLRYQRHSSNAIATNLVPAKTAADVPRENAPSSAPAAPEPLPKQDAVSVQTMPAAPSIEAKDALAFTVPSRRKDEASNERLAVGGRVRGQLAHGPKITANQLQQNANGFQLQAAPPASPAPLLKQQLQNDLKSPQAPALADAMKVQVEASQPEVAREDAPKNLQQLVVQNQKLSDQTSAYGTAELKRAKPADQDAMSGLAPKVPGRLQMSGAEARDAKILATPRWSINSSGSLQRSYDQGVTWQEVRVQDSPALEATVVTRSEPASTTDFTKSKDAPAKVTAKKEAFSAFRAVSANGSEVWAGASGGLLYHSVDGGANWTRVVPSALGSSLSGDVVAIEFTDAEHGKVSTSASEIWITSDGGKTWSKQ